MDRIELRQIVAHGRHGANPGERDRTQPFHIDLTLDVDLSRAGQTDELHDTIDYAELHARVRRIVEEHSYHLLERLATVIATDIFRDPRIMRAEIRVAKPALLDGATPAIVLARDNRSR